MSNVYDTHHAIRKLEDARKAFFDALCDAQSRLMDDLEPVVCSCGSRRMEVIDQAARKRAYCRRRRCRDCGEIALTAEFVVARRAADRK